MSCDKMNLYNSVVTACVNVASRELLGEGDTAYFDSSA